MQSAVASFLVVRFSTSVMSSVVDEQFFWSVAGSAVKLKG